MCKGKRSYIFFENSGKKREFKEVQNRKPGSKSLKDLLETGDTEFIDFIEVLTYLYFDIIFQKCLVWDPTKRITPFQALQHNWILKGLPK